MTAAAARLPWYVGPGSTVGAGLLHALGSSWRLEHGPGWHERDREALERPVIYAFWHSRLLPLTWTHRDRGIVVLVSRHRDGEWIARVLERLGSGTARGSSTRGGDVGLKALLRHARAGRSLAVTPDGPRGPAERVKAGVIYAAARTGLPLLPLTMGADRAWVLRSWDRFRIPQPFARVRLGYGEPIAVPRDAGPEAVETYRLRLEHAIDELTRTTAAAVGERHVPLPEQVSSPADDEDDADTLSGRAAASPEDAA